MWWVGENVVQENWGPKVLCVDWSGCGVTPDINLSVHPCFIHSLWEQLGTHNEVYYKHFSFVIVVNLDSSPHNAW